VTETVFLGLIGRRKGFVSGPTPCLRERAWGLGDSAVSGNKTLMTPFL